MDADDKNTICWIGCIKNFLNCESLEITIFK